MRGQAPPFHRCGATLSVKLRDSAWVWSGMSLYPHVGDTCWAGRQTPEELPGGRLCVGGRSCVCTPDPHRWTSCCGTRDTCEIFPASAPDPRGAAHTHPPVNSTPPVSPSLTAPDGGLVTLSQRRRSSAAAGSLRTGRPASERRATKRPLGARVCSSSPYPGLTPHTHTHAHT